MSSSAATERRAAARGAAALLLAGTLSLAAGCGGGPGGFSAPRPRILPERPHLVPEADRTLARVLLALRSTDRDLALQRPILERLPRYTTAYLLVPREIEPAIAADLAGRPVPARVELVPYDRPAPAGSAFFLLLPDRDRLVRVLPSDRELAEVHGTRWAQDLFEVVRDERDRLVLLAPWVQRHLLGPPGAAPRRLVPDTAFLDGLAPDGARVAVLPVAFNGGNVIHDVVGGRRIALVGGDALRKTRTLARAYGERPPDAASLRAELARALGAEEVVVIGGDRPQPALLYHLDQALLPLGEDRMAVARLTSVPPGQGPVARAARFLEQVRRTLRRLGYRIVDVPVTPADLSSYRDPVNGVPYVDAETGRRMLLLPQFRAGSPLPREPFEREGFRVVPVPTAASELKGGVHCLVNVLE